MANYMFEFHFYCSSFIVRQPNGTLMTGRVFDFDDFFDKMRDITYLAKFTNNGTYLFESVMFAGIVANGGGQKRGIFNIEMNERMPNATDQNGNWTNTAISAFKGNIPVGWLVREVLTNC
jgi:hypothetical protein